MMEMIVFAITLVVAQAVAGIIIMKVCMSKRFIKKYYDLIMELSEEIAEEALARIEEEA